MKFDLKSFLTEIAEAAPVVLATVVAIKDNPEASDFAKASVALTAASQTASEVDPSDAATIQAINTTGQTLLQQFGQILAKSS